MNKQGVTTLAFTVALALVVLALVLVNTSGLAQESTLWVENAPLTPLGTAFTYQGRLSDGASPANGEYDFLFSLYDALSGGSQVGGTVTANDLPVSDGYFIALLDFGGSAFNGQALQFLARYWRIRSRVFVPW